MNCKEVRNQLLDMVEGTGANPVVDEHVKSCAACAAELKSLRATMSLLDEWKAPADTSPYFMTRLRARLDDEPAPAAWGWLQWFRKPALALSMAALMAVSISLFYGGNVDKSSGGSTSQQAQVLKPGTAVADLQFLDRNHEVLTDFDVLDDLDSTPAVQQ